MLPKSKIYAIGLLAAVAVAGFAAGAATMSRAETRRPADLREQCRYSSQLRDRLGLSAAQFDSIRAIMDSHRSEMQAIIAPVRDRLDSVRARTGAEIRAVLTPEQRARYDEMTARDRARWDSTARRQAPAGTR